ncbi:hypothetical protein BG006_003932 [Podila minutissima]|uniref:Uncharacterized protein n=1 Tax=Podila minutissima TaxID=64525 RepID=A0A9P5VN91_9FUNG|nr:hypothetical protein BG006_003932 [Podila minutissima]
MKKASNWAAKWFASPSPPFSPSGDPSTPRSVHSTISSSSQPRRLNSVANDSTVSFETDNVSVQHHPYGIFGSTTTTASVSCSSIDTTAPSLDDSNPFMLGCGYNTIKKDCSFLKPWKRHNPHSQGRLAQAASSAPDIRLGAYERNMTLSRFPEPPGQSFSPTFRRHPPGGSGSSVSSSKSNLRNMFLPRNTPGPEQDTTVHRAAVFSSSSSSVCSVSSTSLTVIRYKPPEPVTTPQRPLVDQEGQSKGIQGWSERLSQQSKRFRSSLLSNGTRKAFTPSALGSGIHTHNHSTTSLPPTMPGTPTSLSPVSYPSPSPAESKVAVETCITAAEAAQARDTSTPPTGATTKDAKISKESPLPPLPYAPPPVLEDGDNLSLAYGLMLQSLPEEQLSAQVANLFGIALHFQQKIERLEKELQALEKRRLVPRRSVPKKLPASLPPAPDQPLPKIPEQSNLEDTKPSAPPSPTTNNTNVPDGSDAPSITNLITAASIDLANDGKTEIPSNKSENEDRNYASLSETIDQDATQKVHEDLKTEIRRDLQASRSIFTALLSPTVISLIQSSFPTHRPCKSGREESKVVTSPVDLGYVPSMVSTMQESKDTGICLSSSGAGRSTLKSGTVSDQIVYPSALRSNPILLSRGLKIVQSDSPTPKMTSSPIALGDTISDAEENDQEQKPLVETGSCVESTAVVSCVDKPAKGEYPEEQEANDRDTSSSSSLPPPRPQRPEISADLDYLMTVFHSQLIAREQSWLEQTKEEGPPKREENKDISGTQKTSLRTPPPTPQCPEPINPTPSVSSSSSSSPIDRSLVQKTLSPPNSTPSSSAVSIGLATPEMNKLQNRQLRLEQDVQHLMDVLTGHAHIQAKRSHLHECHTGRCNHAHHHPRYYSGKDEYAHVEDEDEQEQEQYADMGTLLPPHIEELQHHATNTTEEVRAEILEGSGPAIETNVLSTITTTTAHTTVIEVPIWPSSSSGPSSSMLTSTVRPLVVRPNKNKMRPAPVSSPSNQHVSSSSSSSSAPSTPRTVTATNSSTTTTAKDDMTRRIAQLQHSHHETQVLHEQLDQFWDRLQTVESSQRAGLWQERYHDLHERLLDMEFWKRSIGGSKNKDGKK